MRLFLVLEHRFSKHLDGNVYCERVVDYNFIKRYLNVFEEVVICGRFTADNVEIGKLKVSGENVSFVELPNFAGIKGLAKHYLSIYRIIQRESKLCDAVLLRAPSHLSLIAFSAINKLKKPLAVEMVANPRTGFSPTPFDSLHSRILKKIMRIIMVNHAKSLCINSNGVAYVTKNALQEEFPNRAKLYGESKEYFEEHYSTINLKEKDYFPKGFIKKNNEIFTICHIGYMDGMTKGHITVIDTLKILSDMGYEVKVKFIGTGKLIETFKEYSKQLGLEKNIDFVGSLYGYSEVQRELLNSDLFLFPTMSEGLPRGLIEAMSNKLACVSSPVDGIPELLDSDFLAPYDSPEDNARLVANLIDNPELREKAAVKNFNRSKEYSEQELVPRRNRFYSKLYRYSIDSK